MDKLLKWLSRFYDKFLTFDFNIQMIIKWFPIISKDRQWDHYYFFKILYFKLSLMENFITSGKSHCLTMRDAKKLEYVKYYANDYWTMIT